MKHLERLALYLLAAMCLVSCATKKAVPENFPFTFKDNNPHQVAGAKVYGIEPVENREGLTKKVLRKLKHIEEAKALYQAAMTGGRLLIADVKDAQTANETFPLLAKLEHRLTSEREIKAEWVAKMKELGLVYDKATGQYVQGVKA